MYARRQEEDLAGFALIFNSKEPTSAQSPVWIDFLDSVAAYKYIEKTGEIASGSHCIAAKLDAPCSLHRHILRDAKTGSWLVAVGTVIDPADLRLDGGLGRLLYDYLERGPSALTRLDGQFALLIYDPRQESLSLISDPFGLIPIYYGQAGGSWYASTSALAVAQVLHTGLDELQARSFLLYGYVLSGSLWRDVHCLPPATVLTISPDGVIQHPYWSFDIDMDVAQYSENEALDCMLESFSQSIRQGLGREGKMWVSLTGGLDSRTLIALTAYNQLPFKAYCHGPRDSPRRADCRAYHSGNGLGVRILPPAR